MLKRLMLGDASYFSQSLAENVLDSFDLPLSLFAETLFLPRTVFTRLGSSATVFSEYQR